MSLKNQWLLNIAMVVLSWLTLPLLGRRNIKRYLPASILIVTMQILSVLNVKNRKWWVFYNKPDSFFTGEFPFNLGPFLIGSMWILKWSYGNFKRFLLLNAIVDGGFSFWLINLFKRYKVFTLVRMNKLQLFLYLFYKAFFLYGFQYVIENRSRLKTLFF